MTRNPTALITGINGTVGPVLGARFLADGFDVVAWDRTNVSPDDPAGCREFIQSVRPDVVAHLALGASAWAGLLASAARRLGSGFIFTSTVSVYADRPAGPITVDTPADATTDYARYKLDCEQQVRAAHPGAVIARIGWQIGSTPGSNTMVNFLATAPRPVQASTNWYPACSLLEDTAAALGDLARRGRGGTYLVDSNDQHTFFEIASALQRAHDADWQVTPSENPRLDLRMVDERVTITRLADRLPLQGRSAPRPGAPTQRD